MIEMLDHIKAFLGNMADDPEYRQVRGSAREGKFCGMCGVALKLTNEVWRRAFWVGRFRIRRTAPICRQCHDERDGDRRYFPARSCGGCGRPVHMPVFGRYRHTAHVARSTTMPQS